jgi:hypothetical protein
MKRATCNLQQARMRAWLIAGCVAATFPFAQIVVAGEHASEVKRAAIVVSPGEGQPTSRFGHLKAASEDTLGAYALVEGANTRPAGSKPEDRVTQPISHHLSPGETRCGRQPP